MTTEVLRNMLYANSDALHGLSHVVMDEVHFLADRMRGAVWEEVILHLPEDVRLVSLSATVSNAEEFGGWIQTVRGDTTVVVDEHRPVPLWQHMMVGKRVFDLFEGTDAATGRPRPWSTPSCSATSRIGARPTGCRTGSRGARAARRSRPGGGRPTIYRPPSRPDVIGVLDHEGLLPAITFVFSRAGCDAAVKQCLRSPLRLTDDEERARIAEVIDRRCADLDDADLVVLGYYEWREGLLRGLAAHHAGLLPVFRHTVEELFTAGSGEGRIRHGDTGFGHQHARAHRRAGAAGQVQRRAARAADAGGVHPADGPRRAAAASTSRATPWCCGIPTSNPPTSRGWRRPVRSRCAVRSRRRTT